MGRADCYGFPARNPAVEGRLSIAIRNLGEAWTPFAARDRFAERALRVLARRGTRICGGVSGVLLRADFRGEA